VASRKRKTHHREHGEHRGRLGRSEKLTAEVAEGTEIGRKHGEAKRIRGKREEHRVHREEIRRKCG